MPMPINVHIVEDIDHKSKLRHHTSDTHVVRVTMIE